MAAPTDSIGDNQSDDPFWTHIQGAFWRGGMTAPGFRHEMVQPLFQERAVTFLEEHHREGDGRPFFLYLALASPHTPWLPSDTSSGRSQAGLYGDFVAEVDDVVGQVVSTLERLDLHDNTLVIFTSDNGPVWYPKDEERFGHESNGIFRGMKGDAWEGGHRMPFIVRWPGRAPAGTVSEETFAFTDLLATFAALVGEGLGEEDGPDSHNILAAMSGESSDQPVREAIVHTGNYLALRQGRWKLIPGLGSGGFSTPRTREPGPGEPAGQLYDLTADPGETRNLYGEHPDVVERLSHLLERYREEDRTRPHSSESKP